MNVIVVGGGKVGYYLAETLLEPAAGLKILEFSCMEPSVMKLADRFVAEKEIIWDEMVTGERLF